MKRRAFYLLALSITLGVGAAWVANRWVQTRLSPDVAEADTESVVIAALKVPYGTAIEPRHMKVVKMPAGTVPESAFRVSDDVKGMVAKQEVLAGEILVRDRFAEHLGGSTLAALIDPEYRAITLRVNDVVGVGGFLLPGNRVDVLSSRMVNKRAQTETILKDIKVLAVDQRADMGDNEPVVVRAVTLEVSPKQSEILVGAREEGSIQLALRNPSAIDAPVQLVEEVKPKPAAPKPRPRRTYSPTVEIIRGTDVAKKKVSG
jgi:pilus assembly protein CpaB